MKRSCLFLFLMYFMIFTQSLNATTIISDKSEVSGLWTKGNSPYIIEGEVIIPESAELRIEPGVEVRLKTGVNFGYYDDNFDPGFFRVNGRLLAEGTESDSIIFTRNDSSGYWGNIIFTTKASPENVLKYCRIQYSHETSGIYGGYSTYKGSVHFDSTKHSIISNCRITDVICGISCNETDNTLIIRNNVIMRGYVDGLYTGEGIYCGYSDATNTGNRSISGPLIIGNVIAQHESRGIHCNYAGPKIINNTISECYRGIVFNSSASPEIINSIVVGNNYNFYFSGSNGDPRISYSYVGDMEYGIEDQGNVIVGPNAKFVKHGSHPYYLQEDSPCLNIGTSDTTGLKLTAFDLSGRTRVTNGRLDIGAYEFDEKVFWADLKLPEGGEYWPGESYRYIEYESNSSTINLEYSINNGTSWNTIQKNIENTGEYEWYVPNANSDQCYIRILNPSDNSVFDVNRLPFTIGDQSIVPDSTEVYGTWTLAHSPYKILGEAIIPKNRTLEIEPGVKILFKPGIYNYYYSDNFDQSLLRVNGELRAIGTERDSIIFTRDGDDGVWGMIYFNESSDSTSIMKYCKVEYGNYVGGFYDVEGVLSFHRGLVAKKMTATIEKCNISDNLRYGIYSGGAKPYILNCRIANNERGIVADRSSPYIEGNKITQNKYGIYCDEWCRSEIYNNIISGNSTGISCEEDSEPVIMDNEIKNNTGSGVYARECDVYIARNRISSNDTGIKSGYRSNVMAINNIILGNEDGIYSSDSDPLIVNNVIVENENGLYMLSRTSPRIVSTIFTKNSTTFYFYGNNSVDPSLSYSLVDDVSLDDRFIDSGYNLLGRTPGFVGSGENPYRIPESSVCVDAGDPDTSGVNLPELDFLGNPRINNGRIDIGAYEVQRSRILYLTTPQNNEYWKIGSTQTIEWESNVPNEPVKLEYSSQNGSDWHVIDSNTQNDGSYTWIIPSLNSDSCLVRISFVNTMNRSDVSDHVFRIGNKSVYPAGALVYGVWKKTDSPIIVEGEITIPEGKELSIEPGVEVQFYTGTSLYYNSSYFNVALLRVLGTLKAQGAENDSIIFTRYGDEGEWGVLFFENASDPNSILKYCSVRYANKVYDIGADDFDASGALTFRNAKCTIQNSTIHNNTGKGIYCYDSSNPTIQFTHVTKNGDDGISCAKNSNVDIIHCIIDYNLDYGISCSDTCLPLIEDCLIAENERSGLNASYYSYPLLKNSIIKNNKGNGFSFTKYCVPFLVNCLIIQNKSEEYTGAGVYCRNSSPHIINSTIADNDYGVMGVDDAHPNILNTIIWNNPDGNFGNLTTNFSSYPTYGVSYSLLQGNPGNIGSTNIVNTDPLFVTTGDHPYNLQEGSPCIDGGKADTTGLGLPDYDIAGNARLYQNGRIDIGAYESQFVKPQIIPYISILQNPVLDQYLHFAVNVSHAGTSTPKLIIGVTNINLKSKLPGTWYGSYKMTQTGSQNLTLTVGDTSVTRTFSIGEITKNGGHGISSNNNVTISINPRAYERSIFFAIIYEHDHEKDQDIYEVGSETINFEIPAIIQFKSTKSDEAIYQLHNGEWIELISQHSDNTISAKVSTLGKFKLGPAVRSKMTTELAQNYPNPFNPVTHIKFTLGAMDNGKQVSLNIYNVKGQLINTLIDKRLNVGFYEETWNSTDSQGRKVATGLYFYQLKIGNKLNTKRMLLLK